jgi:DNA-binding CsgD family transcriptional regulator
MPLFVGSSRDVEIERMLSTPSPDFASLASAENSDVIMYTTDMRRNLLYMSKSSWNVCRLDFEKWKKRSFEPMLTDHSSNDFYRSFDDNSLVPNQNQLLDCEIYSDEGERVPLEVRRTLLLYQGEPIGVIGLTRRIRRDMPHVFNLAGSHMHFDFKLASLLTDNERYVVQSVVNGDLNKNIARSCNVTERTIESRRARAMVKLGVKSLPELVRYWIEFSTDAEKHRLSN